MNRFVGKLRIEALSPDELRKRGSAVAIYRLLEDFVYESDKYGVITCPAGMETDFASIPKFALWFINDDSPGILYGSIPHDRVYSLLGKMPDGVEFDREQADDLLAEMMKVCGANALQIYVVHKAVRLGGGSHWKA